MAIECKWSADAFDGRNLAAFRQIHSRGENYVVATDVDRTYRKRYRGIDVQFVSVSGLIKKLTET